MTNGLANELWEETPDAVIALSAERKVLYSNPAAEVLFAYGREGVSGRTLTELIVPPDQEPAEARLMDDALEHGLAIDETVRRRKDGSLLYVSVSTRAVRDAAGTLRY